MGHLFIKSDCGTFVLYMLDDDLSIGSIETSEMISAFREVIWGLGNMSINNCNKKSQQFPESPALSSALQETTFLKEC